MNSLSLQRWSKGVSTVVPMDTTTNVVLKIELYPGMGGFKQICSRFQSAPLTALSLCVSVCLFVSVVCHQQQTLKTTICAYSLV